jgi:hypothetical protein
VVARAQALSDGGLVRFSWLRTGGLLSFLPLAACQATAGQVAPLEPPAPADAAATDAALAEAGVTADSAVPGTDAASDAQVVARDGDGSVTADVDARAALFLRLPEPGANLPRGEEQRSRFCARGRDDLVTDAFCAELAPSVTSLAELFALLDVDPRAYVGSRGISLTGHSTGLSKRSVSAINPRVFFIRVEGPTDPLLAVAFTRGETIVEIVTRSRTRQELEFYVVAFTLRCSSTELGCTPGELLTSAVERDWQSVDVYREDDLKNSPIDCRVCHQPSGPSTPKLLRMQELDTPWTHWFDDHYAAHGDETFAGIPGPSITQARGGLVAAFVNIAGSRLQPNEFPSKQVEDEVESSAPAQPADNQTRGRSQTWQTLYQAAQRAEAIPTPYHDVKITDPIKLAAMQQAYLELRAGRLAQNALPDIRDVLPDDPVALAEMGFTLDERLEDRALLIAACGLCHNARLDQSLSRARFHTDLERLSAEEKQTAIDRLNLPGHDPLAMPPRLIHALSDVVRARLIALLRR